MATDTSDQGDGIAGDVKVPNNTSQGIRTSYLARLAVLRRQHPPLIPTAQSCCYLVLLFLAIQSYFYGSLFQVNTRTHNLHILAVDYDQGIIGTSIQDAYNQLRGPSFPTLVFRPASDYPGDTGIVDAVCGDHYWGALSVHPDASVELQSAIAGNASGNYDASNKVTFVYSGVRYPVIGEAYLAQSMAELTATATQILREKDGPRLLDAVSPENPASLQALFQPFNIKRTARDPVPQGATILLNTFTMIIPPLMQFFFVMALDHISIATHTFTKGQPAPTYVARLAGSNLFAFCASLTVTGCIWAFRETWAVTGLQFFETWFVFWFYMSISYLVMDSFIGTIVPMRFAPFFIFSFVILNVTSTLYPFELNPGFYRWGYALPAHAVWLLLMEVWSDGCVSKLDVALPVLFAWWVAGHFASAFAVWRKCRSSRSGLENS